MTTPTGVQPTVVLVVGRPASGKTTLATAIGERFGLPVVAKDAFKEILFDALGVGDAEWSVRLGRAAFALLDHAIELQLRSGGSFIVEAAYDAEYENAKWQARQQEYGFSVVQVHCTAPADVLVRRMSERVTNGSRHPGHADAERIEEFRRSLSDERRETLDVDGTVLSHRSTDPGSSDAILHTLVGIDARVSSRRTRGLVAP